MNMTGVTITRQSLPSPIVDTLIAALNEELTAMYPEPGATHFRLDPAEVAPGRGAFLVAYRDDTPVGCGAVRRLDSDTAEIKRMYVAPQLRGHGVGRALVDALEREARDLGVQRLVLETGIRQMAAMAMYRRAGFIDIPAFGEYQASSTTSVCMAKELGADLDLIP
jgi:putative acetyltransferase